jgi:hypothetical protein
MKNYRTILILATLITLVGCSDKQILSGTGCSIDLVNDSGDEIVTMKAGGILKVAGWALDNLSKQAPETIIINLVSSNGAVSKFAQGKLTMARPDVNTAYNASAIGNVGFGISAELASPVPGIYEIQILQNFSDRTIVCKSAKSVSIN